MSNARPARRPTDPETDLLFHALADPTRRDILGRCLNAERSISQLAAAYAVSLTAIQKHLKVLERAGLVSRRRVGRMQLIHTRRDGFARARVELDTLEQNWRSRYYRMDILLAHRAGHLTPNQNSPSHEGEGPFCSRMVPMCLPRPGAR